MARPLKPIECSAQPLSISFHPFRDIVAAGLVDGTVEVHDLITKSLDSSADEKRSNKTGRSKRNTMEDDANEDDNDDGMGDDNDSDGNNIGSEDDGDGDTILSSIYVAKPTTNAKSNTKMLAKLDESKDASAHPLNKAVQGPSCRCVLFSRSPHESTSDKQNNNDSTVPQPGGEYLFTACNGGSIKCLDSDRACILDLSQNSYDDNSQSSPILWSIENAHPVGISKLYQLPHSSPCGPLLVSGDDAGGIRLWDVRVCAENHGTLGKDGNNQSNEKNNPFDNLMKPPKGCVMHWKVNHDYITAFESNDDGSTLFATCADGTLSVFDVRFVHRKGTPRSVVLPDIDLNHLSAIQQQNEQQQQQQKNKKSTWETSGYTQSDNQEDELLSIALMKHSQKLLCGSQQGILSLFSYNFWGDITDRFPGHPHSIDAILKIDEDTVLTGSSDGLVRAVQILPNTFLGVLGGHDGFPVEGLGWSAGRKMVGSISHDEHIRLWDASFLNEEEDGVADEDEAKDKEENELKNAGRPMQGLGVSTKATSNDSDDEWEDMDDEEDEDMADSDDDDSDSDDEDRGGNKSKKREKIFKSANEEFFQDL